MTEHHLSANIDSGLYEQLLLIATQEHRSLSYVVREMLGYGIAWAYPSGIDKESDA